MSTDTRRDTAGLRGMHALAHTHGLTRAQPMTVPSDVDSERSTASQTGW